VRRSVMRRCLKGLGGFPTSTDGFILGPSHGTVGRLCCLDCHPEQVFFAQRGIWASRAMQPALSEVEGSRSLRRNSRAFGSLPYRRPCPGNHRLKHHASFLLD